MRLPKLILAGGLLVVLVAYSMGWSGTLHFDGEPNLNGLHGVSDFATGLRFVVSGESGPTGRPLSLATFALQHESWPDPTPFLIFNTVLHILNAVLCFLLLRRLLGWMLEDRRAAEWLAVIVTLAWAASPFLASANLIVVQRMTGLSAFFALLALNIYTIARTGYRPDSWRSNLWLASIAGVGSLLAGLAKENGFLLPVFLLLIEWLLVANARITIKPLCKGFFWIVLVAPFAVILGFLLYKGLTTTGYLYRDFTLIERLLTQPRVLFDYIFNLLIPVTESITPFHDAYRHSTGLLQPITTLFSLLALPALLGLAWLVRHRQPLVAFGLLWFFAGHLSESTLLPVELYFPHRNYIPSIGLYLALVVLLWELAQKAKVQSPILPATAGAIFLLQWAVLVSGTTLWGDPQVAAEIWFKENTESTRAAQYLYRNYVSDGQGESAELLIEQLVEDNPGEAIFTVQALAICGDSERQFEGKLTRAIKDMENADRIMPGLGSLIQQVSDYSRNSDCPFLGPSEAEMLADAGLRSGASIHPAAKHGLLFAKAQLAGHHENYVLAIDLLKESLKVRPTLQSAELVAYFYIRNDDFTGARDFLKRTIANPPVGFRQGMVWKSRLRSLLKALKSRGTS